MLVSVASYRLLTGDASSATTAVSAALLEAQDLLGEALDRDLEEAERTETVEVLPRGTVVPRALPVTSISPASDATGEIRHSGFSVRLTSAPLVEPVTPALDELRAVRYADTDSALVTLTYTGGYAPTSYPATLRRAQARLAHGLLQASERGGAGPRAGGVTSVSLGDASQSFSQRGGEATGAGALVEELVPGLLAALAGYRRAS